MGGKVRSCVKTLVTFDAFESMLVLDVLLQEFVGIKDPDTLRAFQLMSGRQVCLEVLGISESLVAVLARDLMCRPIVTLEIPVAIKWKLALGARKGMTSLIVLRQPGLGAPSSAAHLTFPPVYWRILMTVPCLFTLQDFITIVAFERMLCGIVMGL